MQSFRLRYIMNLISDYTTGKKFGELEVRADEIVVNRIKTGRADGRALCVWLEVSGRIRA